MPAFCCLLLNDFRLHQDIGISGISAAAVARIAGTKEQAKPGHQQDQNTMMLARASALTGLSPSTQSALSWSRRSICP
jgi:Pyruvate/2-oxoacid:ferredoxin oxidoreductase gamma subunit